ncbi:carbon-nitrogen hydrolase family protein [Ignatzschineria cameli]|uniref:carbon-nitrogen hydrolase family protein n=1 Tax=Ignatzschineria cameli TaxID=2182793 RepID=UPI000D618FFB|nr:carbon-nitrogen hydrolase family protein [Ignatzschineria cameli]PWD85642.1 carbon-nitrogen hydrolase [Ignatzschineria cameli]
MHKLAENREQIEIKSDVKVAAIDFIPAWGDLEGNVERLLAAVKEIGQEGIDYAVFPETATTGYLFHDYQEISSFLDTIPGKTTEALLPLLKEYDLYISLGIAERDVTSGLAYNSAVLLGPEGIIGKYRKRGLNSQDQRLFAPGNSETAIFETKLGKIGLLICYDDTYWQYARLLALKGAQIIGWHSVSDRMMPNAAPSERVGDHSTIAHVQHISALNGVWSICATRSGIETHPVTGEQLYYNGGSSIWAPTGEKVLQAPVISPEELPPGLNAIYRATIDPKQADIEREAILSRRVPSLYHPYLALHRVPDDRNATVERREVILSAAQWPKTDSLLTSVKVEENQLLVLPAFSSIADPSSVSEIIAAAEPQGGAFETKLSQIAKAGSGYLVGSYPEREGDRLYHTVVLAGPEGVILGRYRATHFDLADQLWATAGDQITVVETPLGRIGLALESELAIAELGARYAVERADIIAAPARLPLSLKVEIDPALYSTPEPPTGRANYYPYAAATLHQLWVVCGGREEGNFTSSAIYGPEPIILTPTLLAKSGEQVLHHQAIVPAPDSWISQERLIHGQAALWFTPLVEERS